tara:strand:- start:330 stop:560 length:231 start_codon:yes stop_codon:yes gene_type:complete
MLYKETGSIVMVVILINVSNMNNIYSNSHGNIFNDIDTNLLFGIQCSSGNKAQQKYFENLKVQTQAAFINKKFQIN